MRKLNIKAFGLAVGLVWSLGMFLLGIMSALFNLGTKWMEMISSAYIGYNATFLGSIIGAVWGFVDAGIAGLIVAWLYNKFTK
jgi:hypothetical protein